MRPRRLLVLRRIYIVTSPCCSSSLFPVYVWSLSIHRPTEYRAVLLSIGDVEVYPILHRFSLDVKLGVGIYYRVMFETTNESRELASRPATSRDLILSSQ